MANLNIIMMHYHNTEMSEIWEKFSSKLREVESGVQEKEQVHLWTCMPRSQDQGAHAHLCVVQQHARLLKEEVVCFSRFSKGAGNLKTKFIDFLP